MDTILLSNENRLSYSKPLKWIYTDLLGRVQYKDITNLKIEEVIKAFLLNLKKKKNPDGSRDETNNFSNEDLLKFFLPNDKIQESIDPLDQEFYPEIENENLGEKICFVLTKNKH